MRDCSSAVQRVLAVPLLPAVAVGHRWGPNSWRSERSCTVFAVPEEDAVHYGGKGVMAGRSWKWPKSHPSRRPRAANCSRADFPGSRPAPVTASSSKARLLAFPSTCTFEGQLPFQSMTPIMLEALGQPQYIQN